MKWLLKHLRRSLEWPRIIVIVVAIHVLCRILRLSIWLRGLFTWHKCDTPYRVLVLLIVCWFLFAVFGCTTPQPVPHRCEPDARLMQHRDFVTCMTGPWGQQWIRDMRWSALHESHCTLDALVLPIACEPFDVNGDGDVDLRDLAVRIGMTND